MSSAVQHNLPIKIFILNNQYMGMVRQWQQLLHGNRLSHSYTEALPDFVKLAEAYGGVGFKAEKPDELDDMIAEMIAVDKPVLFDCRVAALAILAVLLGWLVGVTLMLGNLDNLSASTDIFLRILQVLGWVAFIGGFLVLAWNLWVTWKGGRRWPAKVWSIALLLAAAIALWIAIAFGLLALGVNY